MSLYSDVPCLKVGGGGPCIVKSNSSWAMDTLGPPPPNEQTDWQTRKWASFCLPVPNLLKYIVIYLFTGIAFWLSSWSIVPCRSMEALITVRSRIHSSEGPRSNKNSTFSVFPFHDVNPCVTYLTFLVAMVTNITKVTANKACRVYCLQYILSTVTVQRNTLE